MCWSPMICIITHNSTIKTNDQWSKHSIIVSFLRQMYGHLIGSLTAEDKAVYILVFSDIKYRQNIASLVVINSWFFGCKNILTEVGRVDVFKNCSVDGLKSLNSIISKTPLWKSMYLITSLSHVLTKPKSTMFFRNFFKGFFFC